MIRFYIVILKNILNGIYLLPKMRHKASRPDKYDEYERFKLVLKGVRCIQRAGHIRTTGYGMDSLPKEGGYVMFPNHQGKYDVAGIFSTHPGPCSFVMDIKKSYMLVAREITDLVQGKRLDKDNVRQAMTVINEMAAEVKAGRKYIIFPEGDYENNNWNRMHEFKPGSFKSAVKAKAPIVPVALIDSYKALNSSKLGPVRTQVHYLEPIYYEEYKELKTPALAALVQERIQAKITSCTERTRK